VKFINKINLLLFCIPLFSFLEAKNVEVTLDHTTQGKFTLENELQDSPFIQCPKKINLRNIGNTPLRNCFPYSKNPYLTLSSLTKKIYQERYPLLALFQIYNQRLTIDEQQPLSNFTPLDLLNCRGVCSQEEFEAQFLALCKSLKIKTCVANLYDQVDPAYDFCLPGDSKWQFFNLRTQQFYIGLDNQILMSSEEIMDDPFLILRSKHTKSNKIDFKDSWNELARFNILEPSSAVQFVTSTASTIQHVSGFDLYPQESLLYELSENSDSTYLTQLLQLQTRRISSDFSYNSPLPLYKIVNQTPTSLYLTEQDTHVLPGETYFFEQTDLFQIHIHFSESISGSLLISGRGAAALFPSELIQKDQIYLGVEENPTTILCTCTLQDDFSQQPSPTVQILNTNSTFHHCTPHFTLKEPLETVETIQWQISSDPHFQLIPANLNQIEPFISTISLSLIDETFFNPDEKYYFRVKGCKDGRWGEWSTPYSFSVGKPLSVDEILFDKVENGKFEISWPRYVERYANSSEAPITYLVFGSNSLDFIPSIYCDKQINSLSNGEVTQEEKNDNLLYETDKSLIEVGGELAYYRIIAVQKGQFSNPSSLIRIYDYDLIQPRNILQFVKNENGEKIAKRTLFSPVYPWTIIALPAIQISENENKWEKLLRPLQTDKQVENQFNYEYPEVSEEIWKMVRPYLMPENHPAWSKLHRIFCKTRATLHHDAFRKAGFNRWRPGKWSRVSASSHPSLQEYFIKAYCDCELGILYDWKRWIHRIKGSEAIRECARHYRLHHKITAPHKWIYPLPKNPYPASSTSKEFFRKNFLLVCENANTYDHSQNEKKYKEMSADYVTALYTIIQAVGLYDSVYPFNFPFSKDGKLVCIDCEYWGKWPVPFDRLTRYFSSKMKNHWKKITSHGGKIPPFVEPQQNHPRMDRRDR
jgi:hypothetical protein